MNGHVQGPGKFLDAKVCGCDIRRRQWAGRRSLPNACVSISSSTTFPYRRLSLGEGKGDHARGSTAGGPIQPRKEKVIGCLRDERQKVGSPPHQNLLVLDGQGFCVQQLA